MRNRIKFLFVCCLLATASICVGQPAPPSLSSSQTPEKRYTLTGTVVNSVTGEPIRRVYITMFGRQQASAMTDADGHFEFGDLPSGQVSFQAQKPGFFGDQQIRQRMNPVQFQVGPDSSSITLKLVPESVITGRIMDSDGFPIFHMPVRAMVQKISNGRREWQMAKSDGTDVNGEFRLWGLQPGNYYLVAGPGRRPAMVTAAGDDVLETGFPEEVYPAGADGKSSVGHKLAPGQQMQVNFSMRPERFFSISGSLSGLPPGGRGGVFLVSNSPAFEGTIGAPVDPETGIFQFPRVPRGDYIVRAQLGEGENMLTASLPLSVKSNINGLQVPLQPMLNIPVKVRIERTKNTKIDEPPLAARGISVQLLSHEQNSPGAFSMPENPRDPASTLLLRNVSPGRYRAQINAGFGGSSPLYVASARHGNTDLLTEEVTINGGGTDSIDLVLRDDGPTLKLKLHSDDEVGLAVVLFVPEKGEPFMTQMAMTNAANRQRMQSGVPGATSLSKGSDGERDFRILRPGQYTVLAFDDVNDLEYLNRNALAPYLARGAKVTLAAGQEASANVNVFVRGGE